MKDFCPCVKCIGIAKVKMNKKKKIFLKMKEKP
jgi:hypothetical protein